MKRAYLLSLLAATALSGGMAMGDWPNDNPTKYVQLPDRQPTGIDVLATVRPTPDGTPPVIGKILADDFPCVVPGPITDIHIWGSWLNDYIPHRTFTDATGQTVTVPDPTNVRFKLSIHDDIPATPPPNQHHSMPANPPRWQRIFEPATYRARPDGTGQELFFNPNTNEWMGTDNTIWQYNFDIPPLEAFFQEGTTANPKIYWLDVQAEVLDPQAVFGWKTSQQHFNDDGVYGDAPFGADPPVWDELRYPLTPVPAGFPHPFAGTIHPFYGQSMDLAFALTTIPEPAALPFVAIGAWLLVRRRR